MNKLFHILSIVLVSFFCSGLSYAQTSTNIKLHFQRTGKDAKSVTVQLVDEKGAPIQGASANVDCTAPLKGSTTQLTPSILCPNQNGNESPNITLNINMKGLPVNFTFNQIGIDLHAFNGVGKYQSNNDGITRQYNLAAKVGKTKSALQEFGVLSNFDAAAGVGEPDNVHKVWTIQNKQGVTTDGEMVLSLNITAGAANKGCFLGISDIVLSSGEMVGPEPEPQPEPGLSDTTKVYNIIWKNTTTQHMSEEADGTVVVTSYDIAQRIFWKLIPTKNKNCYYIQNTATGRYVGSCNMPPLAESLIHTSEQPIEYYVGKTAGTNAEISGCYYFSSTDCANYNNENAGPQALNKAGSTNSVITWQAGTGRIGSYWKLVETEDLYEIRPFMASREVGKADYPYVMVNAKGLALEMNADGTLAWKEKNENDAQVWYFVGTSNHDGGYLIVNQKSHQVYSLEGETDTRWAIFEDTNNAGFNFRPFATKDDAATNLTVEGESALHFQGIHTKFARHNQVYELPCGSLGEQYLVRLSISGEIIKPMQYPLPTVIGNTIVNSNAEKPADWYTLYAKDKAIVARGQQFTVSTQLSSQPLEGQEGFLYFDWNRDGIFEFCQEVDLQQNSQTTITVPADAKAGKTRFRFRLTDNGFNGADEEVTGQIFDGVLDIEEKAPAEPTLTVVANSDDRGEVTPTSDKGANKACEVKATPKGNAVFVCWKEGNNIVSLDATYKFTLTHETHLTAVFSPNTDEVISGIDNQFAENDQMVNISASHKQIKVVSNAKIQKVLVFSPNGSLVAQSNDATLNLSGTASGTYIVKVYTDCADKTAKLLIK